MNDIEMILRSRIEELERRLLESITRADAASPDGRRLFFRQHKSVADIIELARSGNFQEFSDKFTPDWDPSLDIGAGCGESCEIGADDLGALENDGYDLL